MRNYLFCILSSAFLCSCASTYKTISPQTLSYTPGTQADSLEFAYKYDVLRESGNKKYAKKEMKKGVRIAAIKITNHTDRTINLANDIEFYYGNNVISPMSISAIKKDLQQNAPLYALYLLLTPMTLEVHNGTSSSSTPIGYIIGPGLAISNIVIAATANKNFVQELKDNNILSRNIQRGETIYGIIGIHESNFNTLSIKLKKK